MSQDTSQSTTASARESALKEIAAAAQANIPGVDIVSVTVNRQGEDPRTIAATDPMAEKLDALQYELREGPCFAAVTDERFVLVNDLANSSDFPRYGAEAAARGLGSQAAIQLLHDGERAGLNLYAYDGDAFDRSTVQLAELFATQAGAVLQYAKQVEQLSDALHTRTDIGIAVGILMERYRIDRDRAFGFLVRNSNNRNIRLRVLALQIIDGTFTAEVEDGPED